MDTSSPKAAHDADVVIVGAGPAGLSLACALADIGLRSIVLEQQDAGAIEQPAEDGREIALTHRARGVMETLGLWQHLAADDVSPLREARVQDGGRPGLLHFAAAAGVDEPLGWLVPNHRIRAAAIAAARMRDGIRIEYGARVTALELGERQAAVALHDGRRFGGALVVAADNRFSGTRRLAGIGASLYDFARSAIVARVSHDGDNQATAWECFHYGNTLALLPITPQQSSAVLTVPSQRVEEYLALSDERFCERVGAQAPETFGHLRTVGKRHHYPLVAVFAHDFAARRFALIGDAAVGMHPVTAHGWNFGLYGVEVLARELKAACAAGCDAGDPGALRAYAREHRRTTLPIWLGTNAIVSLFTDDRMVPKLLRRGVLAVAEHLP
ncbi:MAG: 5-demethoxyubiquinol-8 5-hydroxylase UbiM, partial [Pseudomonadota bacterium]|nr:5-demethoxyubiquinol-8 5-hydroxylase UbiM [Pseudomonadota bacterium]